MRLTKPTRRSRGILLGFVLLAVAACAAKNESPQHCRHASPSDLTALIFEEYYGFFIAEQPETFRDLVTDDFAQLLDEHAACASQYGLCVIDFDPWIDGQDGYIDGDIDSEEIISSSTRAQVTLTFSIRTHPDHEAIPRTVSLVFLRKNAQDCWRMDDLLVGGEYSLKQQLQEELPRYKAALEASSRGLAWTLIESSLYSSRVQVRRDDQVLGTYELNCDLSAEANEPDVDLSLNETNRVDIVSLGEESSALLVAVCSVGAHSREISIFDTGRSTDEPAFSKVGSYFADWRLEGGDLCISYDQPCSDDSCDQAFTSAQVSWNALMKQGHVGCGE